MLSHYIKGAAIVYHMSCHKDQSIYYKLSFNFNSLPFEENLLQKIKIKTIYYNTLITRNE
jgi:hypothetical protein